MAIPIIAMDFERWSTRVTSDISASSVLATAPASTPAELQQAAKNQQINILGKTGNKAADDENQQAPGNDGFPGEF